MEYTVNKLASLSGVSAQTLRYYDEIGLLSPERSSENDYRIYKDEQVDLLQQILFYRELGVGLDEIKSIVSSPEFDREAALENHLTSLKEKRDQLELLIKNVSRTIGTIKGETFMNDKEKFEGFKNKLIEENEEKYGGEIRKKYGDESVDGMYSRIKGMTNDEWQRTEALRKEIDEALRAAVANGDPAGELAQKTCALHKQWICMMWKDGAYTKQAHMGLGEMYVADERFKAYYDRVADGAAEFLNAALKIFCK